MSQIGAANGISERINRVRQQMGIVLPGEGEQVAVIQTTRYDVQSVANAGTTDAINFFQSAYSPQTTNVKVPGQLCQSGIFVAQGMGFHLWPSADNQIDDDLTAGDLGQGLINYLNGGFIQLSVNDKVLVEDFGLFRWPGGGGAYAQLAAATTATTTSWTGAVVTNGFPSSGNMRKFDSPLTLTNADVVNLSVRYGSAIALPGSATLKLMGFIYGVRLQDSER